MPVAAAGITAGASLLGGIVGGKGAKKAAKVTAAAAQNINNQNIAFANETRDKNTALFQPTVNRGNAAGAQINALLGLGGNDYGSYVNSNADLLADWQKNYAGTTSPYADIDAFGQHHYNTYGKAEGRTVGSAADAATSALDIFKNSAGYQDRLDASMKAVNTGYAARGALESGAAQKSLQKNASVLAGDYFGSYLSALGGQQSAGITGMGAIAGANTNASNQVIASNTATGSAAASANANGILGQTAAYQNALSGVAGAAGNVFGSSYKPVTTTAQPTFGSGGIGPGGAMSYQPISVMSGYAPGYPR